MGKIDSHHPLWEDAWVWVVQQHGQSIDQELPNAFFQWIETSPEHRAVYEAACRIWLLAGFIPSSEENGN